MYSNASSASASRIEGGTPPAFRASRTSGYRDGLTTTATRPAFFAAARISATPPTSMFSTASAWLTPGFATVSSNG